LEDTKTPGKEEEEEKSKAEKIADEEHGVEMTDDFEGAMEDLAMEGRYFVHVQLELECWEDWNCSCVPSPFLFL
jgi:hypothetical protein